MPPNIYNPNSMDAKLSQILTNQENDALERKRMFEVLEDHGKRISGLEKWRTRMTAIASIGIVGFELSRDWVKDKLFS